MGEVEVVVVEIITCYTPKVTERRSNSINIKFVGNVDVYDQEYQERRKSQ